LLDWGVFTRPAPKSARAYIVFAHHETLTSRGVTVHQSLFIIANMVP
jgi:hypothetical protein